MGLFLAKNLTFTSSLQSLHPVSFQQTTAILSTLQRFLLGMTTWIAWSCVLGGCGVCTARWNNAFGIQRPWRHIADTYGPQWIYCSTFQHRSRPAGELAAYAMNKHLSADSLPLPIAPVWWLCTVCAILLKSVCWHHPCLCLQPNGQATPMRGLR